jgi:hypothetical protein
MSLSLDTQYKVREISEFMTDFLGGGYTEADIPHNGTLLGEGSFSLCYEVDGYCIKLGGMDETDRAGQLWTEWALEHQHLACCPKIYHYEVIHTGVFLVVTELLSKVQEYSGDVQDTLNTYADCLRRWGRLSAWGLKYVPDYVLEFCDEFDEIRPAFQLDLHNDNYMCRVSTGEFVVTDPVSYLKDAS